MMLASVALLPAFSSGFHVLTGNLVPLGHGCARIGVAMCARETVGTHVAADALFSMIDENGDGFITFRELADHFALSDTLSQGGIEHVFDMLDINRDGEICQAELRESFAKFEDAALLQALGLGETESDAVFNAIDANGDGEVTKAELTAYLRQKGHSTEVVDSIFETLDANHDGAISRDELHEGYATYSGLRSVLLS